MNRVEFRVTDEDYGTGRHRGVLPVIDGVPLVELARRVEEAAASAEGHRGCWPLSASVRADARFVHWTHFRTGHRDWDLGDLGPFRFERRSYERALADAGLH